MATMTFAVACVQKKNWKQKRKTREKKEQYRLWIYWILAQTNMGTTNNNNKIKKT